MYGIRNHTSSSSVSSVPMVVTVTGMLLVRLTTGVFLTLPSTAAVSPSVTSATSFATGNCTYVLG